MACAVLTMQRAPLAREKVLFVIDEAADLGRIEHLPQWLATLRKYQVVLWPIFQNMGQLAELYGRGWQTLTANCGLLQILSIGNELETAEAYRTTARQVHHRNRHHQRQGRAQHFAGRAGAADGGRTAPS